MIWMNDYMLACIAITATVGFLLFVTQCLYYENNTPEKQKSNAEANRILQENINVANYGVPWASLDQIHRK